MAKYKVNVTEKNFGWRGVVRRWQNTWLPVESGGNMIHPFYVIRILQDKKQPVYWKSHSYPASPSLGEATVFRDANSAWEVRQTVKTRIPGIVDAVAVNLESIIKK